MMSLKCYHRRPWEGQMNDKLSSRIGDDGTVPPVIPCYSRLELLKGAAGKLDRPLSLHEMREIARDDRVTEWLRRKQ